MEEETQYPVFLSRAPISQHVSDLLAAISKIETLRPSQFLTLEPLQARNPGTAHAKRISEVLDAFTTLCVSRKHEVIAICRST